MELSPIAQLQTIHCGRPSDGDEDEAAKLFKAANVDGFFYLDLQGSAFAALIDVIEDVFALSKALFGLSEEEKLRYDIDMLGKWKLNGYKPVGRNVGGVKGNRDGFESYTIPGKTHLDPSFARPPLLSDHLPTVTSFCGHSHEVFNLLLSSLSTSLGLSPEASLTRLHRNSAPSPDILRLLHYLAQPTSETGAPQTPHTDLGSLTLLFTKSPGLQVLAPHSSEWAHVLTKAGCAIVNVGDGLSLLTGNLLHSCLHRVAPPPGCAMEERYSLAYLQRTEDDVRMETLPGIRGSGIDADSSLGGNEASAKGEVIRPEVYTSKGWVEKKFGMLRRDTWKEGSEGARILTGRADEVGP